MADPKSVRFLVECLNKAHDVRNGTEEFRYAEAYGMLRAAVKMYVEANEPGYLTDIAGS